MCHVHFFLLARTNELTCCRPIDPPRHATLMTTTFISHQGRVVEDSLSPGELSGGLGIVSRPNAEVDCEDSILRRASDSSFARAERCDDMITAEDTIAAEE